MKKLLITLFQTSLPLGRMFVVIIAAASNAMALESRTNEIRNFNSQAGAKTIAELCSTMTSGNIDWGRGQIKCSDVQDGVISITARNSSVSVTVRAGANDKAVLEFAGDDENHLYKNDQGESFRINFSWVNEGVHRNSAGATVTGHYRGDAVLFKGSEKIRTGYYINN